MEERILQALYQEALDRQRWLERQAGIAEEDEAAEQAELAERAERLARAGHLPLDELETDEDRSRYARAWGDIIDGLKTAQDSPDSPGEDYWSSFFERMNLAFPIQAPPRKPPKEAIYAEGPQYDYSGFDPVERSREMASKWNFRNRWRVG